jgi:hypothetical protein
MLGIYGDMDCRPARMRAKAAQEIALQIDDALGKAYASAHQWLGFVLGMTGLFDEARKTRTSQRPM